MKYGYKKRTAESVAFDFDGSIYGDFGFGDCDSTDLDCNGI